MTERTKKNLLHIDLPGTLPGRSLSMLIFDDFRVSTAFTIGSTLPRDTSPAGDFRFRGDWA